MLRGLSWGKGWIEVATAEQKGRMEAALLSVYGGVGGKLPAVRLRINRPLIMILMPT